MTEGPKRHRRKLEQAMPKPRETDEAVPYDEINSCLRKVSFRNKRAAKIVARRYDCRVRPYRRRYCDRWHLGSK